MAVSIFAYALFIIASSFIRNCLHNIIDPESETNQYTG
jgi:hypothetical protein